LATIDYGIYEQGFKFAQLEKIIMTEYAAKKPDIIILDFIQLIDWKEYGDERIALDEYARKIKELAKTLKIGFIILSQLRRLPSGANTQRAPEQSDLKGSGGLEAVADKVILLYKTVEGDYPDERSKYFLKLDKNRQGPTLTKELLYFGRTFTFAEIARPAIKGEEKQAKLFE
jgi:replicative DNA helicase